MDSIEATIVAATRLGARLPARVAACVAACAVAGALAAIATPTGAVAQSALARAGAGRPVEVEIRSAARAVVPGDTVAVAIRLRPNPGWHTYWRHAGDVGSTPSIAWRLPAGFTAAPLRWPAPSLIAAPPLASYGYEREVHLLGAVHVPRTARVGSRVTLAATVPWVACEVECVAGDVDLALTLSVAATPALDMAAVRAFAAEAARVPERRAGWTFRAAVDSSAVVLRVRPPAGHPSLPADTARVRFFADSAGVVDHAAPAELRADGADLELRLRRSPYAAGAPARVTGVLTVAAAARGAARLTPDPFALDVDAPVVAMAELGRRVRPPTASGGDGWVALATAGLLALLGGTLLNLMPCVLPVLSIKALGVAEGAAHDARAARRHTLLFAAGVLASMWALVGALLALRAAGAEVGCGYQLQSPAVVGALALLIVAAALNMAGVFELMPVGGALSAAADRAPRGVEAFLGGVLVTALATPCSAPFLATATAFALAGGAARAFVVFTALGLGLVWPLAVIASAPRLRRWLPRTGAWMVTLRQALAFTLLATVVWLAWVLGRQAGVDALSALLAALTLLAFGLWALGRFGTVVASAGRRRVARGAALAAAAGALALVIAAPDAPASSPSPSGARSLGTTSSGAAAAATSALPWCAYDAAALEALRDSGRVVLLDFTADWCLTCQVNERVAFGSGAVRAAVRSHDVALLRADWTRRDPVVTRALAAFGRNSVPFVVLYPRDRAAKPIILPTLLTPGIVTAAIGRAAPRSATRPATRSTADAPGAVATATSSSSETTP